MRQRDLESIFRADLLKIVLQHNPPETGHCSAWLARQKNAMNGLMHRSKKGHARHAKFCADRV
jgi:hypothetical protein